MPSDLEKTKQEKVLEWCFLIAASILLVVLAGGPKGFLRDTSEMISSTAKAVMFMGTEMLLVFVAGYVDEKYMKHYMKGWKGEKRNS